MLHRPVRGESATLVLNLFTRKKKLFSLSPTVLADLSLSPKIGLYNVVYYYSSTVPAGLPLSYRPIRHNLFIDSGETLV